MKRNISFNTTKLFVMLCRWLWEKQSFFWGTVILGIIVNFVSTWLLQSQSIDYGGSPFGLTLNWMTQHIPIVLCVGILILLLDIVIYLVSHSKSTKTTDITTTSVALATPHQASPLDVVKPTGMPLIQLVNRVAQLERIKRVIYNGELGGVCVLTGINGVGKTVLAAKVVYELAQDALRFPGGALWIRCENLKGNEGLNEFCLRVARRLQVDLLGKDIWQDSLEQMRDRLSHILSARPRTLLALDNLEPELDIDAVTKMLVLPGHTSLLITTLRPLDVETDDQFILAPLEPQDSKLYYKEQLHSRDSSRPNEDDWRFLPKLVEALGGLPLAIKLTAAYATYRDCSLEQVLKEVQEDGLQKAGLKGLRNRFERLYLMLPEQQRILFAGLSLVRGSTFPRKVVKAIIESIGITKTARPYSDDDIDALVTLALVEMVGAARLRLHPLLRQYATEKLYVLPANLQERMGDAMLSFWCSHVTSLAHDAAEMTHEAEGLMGAVAWAHERKHHENVLYLVRLLSQPWESSGRLIEAARMYLWALEAAEALQDISAQYWATFKLARNDACLGKMKESSVSFQQALKLAIQLKDLSYQQQVIYEVAIIDDLQGRSAEAQTGFKQVLELAKQMKGSKDSIKAECNAIHGLSRNLSKKAERLLQQANEAENTEKAEASRLQAQQMVAEACKGFQRELELAAQISEPLKSIEIERTATHELARLDEMQGKLKEAYEGFEKALALSHKLKDRFYISTDQRHLGFIIGRQGDRKKAAEMINEALKYFVQSGDLYASGLCYLRLAELEKEATDKLDIERRKQVITYLREALWRFEYFNSPRAETVTKELQKLEM